MRSIMLVLYAYAANGSAQSVLTASDLKLLEGNWKGELTYINYTDGSPSTIPATLLFAPVDDGRWRIGFGYTEEPQANALDTAALGPDGRIFDGLAVVNVEHPTADSLHIVLVARGEDDHRPATITKTWRIGPHRCTMRKEVLFLDKSVAPGDTPMFRHEYRFRR